MLPCFCLMFIFFRNFANSAAIKLNISKCIRILIFCQYLPISWYFGPQRNQNESLNILNPKSAARPQRGRAPRPSITREGKGGAKTRATPVVLSQCGYRRILRCDITVCWEIRIVRFPSPSRSMRRVTDGKLLACETSSTDTASRLLSVWVSS